MYLTLELRFLMSLRSDFVLFLKFKFLILFIIHSLVYYHYFSLIPKLHRPVTYLFVFKFQYEDLLLFHLLN